MNTREKLIQAHREQDWERAKILSQLRQREKTIPGVCLDCGVPVSKGGCGGQALRCRMHFNLHKHYARALTFCILLFAAIGSGQQASQPQPITFQWEYPPQLLSTNLTFILHHSADLNVPLTNWPALTNAVGTATNLTIIVTPSEQFYYLTASNWWGESDPSNVAGTVAPGQSGVLHIRRGN